MCCCVACELYYGMWDLVCFVGCRMIGGLLYVISLLYGVWSVVWHVGSCKICGLIYGISSLLWNVGCCILCGLFLICEIFCYVKF